MKYFYRFLIVAMCLILWTGIGYTATRVSTAAEQVPYQNAFSFPCLLQETDLYLWTLNSDKSGTRLLIQNIGEVAISDAEIVFLSFGKYYIFKAEQIQPGQKLWVSEQTGNVLPIEHNVICTSFCVN